ncbi:hypothetical protein JHK87_041755 [Glycine soja]|nr:hypothetical protein JHK87_041755 [Glycine soja]
MNKDRTAQSRANVEIAGGKKTLISLKSKVLNQSKTQQIPNLITPPLTILFLSATLCYTFTNLHVNPTFT